MYEPFDNDYNMSNYVYVLDMMFTIKTIQVLFNK